MLTIPGKHLCQSHFFNKVTGLRPATLSKRRVSQKYSSVNFAKLLGTPFFYRTVVAFELESWKYNAKLCRLSKINMRTKPWVYVIFVINLQSFWKQLRFLYIFEDVCNFKRDECNKQVVVVGQYLKHV